MKRSKVLNEITQKLKTINVIKSAK